MAVEEGLATVDAGLAAMTVDTELADEAVTDVAEEEDEVGVLVEVPPVEPPPLPPVETEQAVEFGVIVTVAGPPAKVATLTDDWVLSHVRVKVYVSGLTVNSFLSEDVTVRVEPADSWIEKLEELTDIESKFAVPLTTKLTPFTFITAESDIVTSSAAKAKAGAIRKDSKAVK